MQAWILVKAGSDLEFPLQDQMVCRSFVSRLKGNLAVYLPAASSAKLPLSGAAFLQVRLTHYRLLIRMRYRLLIRMRCPGCLRHSEELTAVVAKSGVAGIMFHR